jgi:tetratricopeptide (TPR) repeat protein
MARCFKSIPRDSRLTLQGSGSWGIVGRVARRYNSAMHAANPMLMISFLLLMSSIAIAEDQFREREVLDPNSDSWTPAPVDEVLTPLAEARRLIAAGEQDDARDLLEDWLAENFDSENYYDGVYLLGEAFFADKHYWQAVEQFDLVADSTAGELFFAAIRRSMDVARAFLAGEPRIVWKILRLPARPEGVEILDRVEERVPGTRLSQEALKVKADYFFEDGQMDLAQDEYQRLYRDYPEGRYARAALLRSAVAAEASFNGIRYDDQPLLEADERYRTVQDVYPAFAERMAVAERLSGIRRQRAEKDLEVGRWYERSRNPEAAAFYYRLVIRDYRDTQAADEARSRLLDLGFTVEPSDEDQPL